jgi:hypothetical protein
MNALMAAITAKFKTTNSLNTALGGRMYPFQAPQEPTFPYGIYFIVSGDPDRNFSDKHEYINVQFSLFSEEDSVEQVGTLYDKTIALFDDVLLTVTGYTMLKFERINYLLIRDEEMATWHYVVEYDVLLEK